MLCVTLCSIREIAGGRMEFHPPRGRWALIAMPSVTSSIDEQSSQGFAGAHGRPRNKGSNPDGCCHPCY